MEFRIIRMLDIWCVLPNCTWRTPLTFNRQFLAFPVFDSYEDALALYFDVLNLRRNIEDKVFDEDANRPMNDAQFKQLCDLITEEFEKFNEQMDKILGNK